MMKPFTGVIAALLIAGLVHAQEKAPAKVVRVIGTSEVNVVPDRAVIEVGVEKQNANAGLAKRAADAVSRRIFAALRNNGVDERDIQTTFLSLQPQSSYHKGVRSSWFVASQTMTVTVCDLTRLDELLGSLIKAGGNRIDSIRYETSNLRKYRDQARELAVKAAREKGEALAKALGQGIGKAQSIEEIPEPASESPYEIFTRLKSNYSYNAPSPAAPVMAAGQQRISASVVISFELM